MWATTVGLQTCQRPQGEFDELDDQKGTQLNHHLLLDSPSTMLLVTLHPHLLLIGQPNLS